MKMRYRITLLFLMLISTASAQSDSWQDTYKKSTYNKALEHCKSLLPNDSFDCAKPCFNYIGLFDLKFNVEFEYADSIKVVDQNRKKYIDRWTKAYWPDGEYKDLFKHQISVSTKNESYWIMIQEPTHEYYVDELKKGDRIQLYLMFVGTIVIGDNTQYIFVANDFLKL